MNRDEYFDRIDERDHSSDGPHGWIQWKGTDACVDVHCLCGAHGHIDGDFFYRYQCLACGRKYAVGSIIKLIELTEDEAAVEFLGYYVDERLRGGSDGVTQEGD